MSSWPPGTRLDSYEIVDVLGRGGMGKVYRVRHLITNRIEALKVIAAADASGEESLERFLREIRVLATLDHPNIAGLHTAFRYQERLVMVMEYVPGADLGVLLRAGITLDQSLDVVRQILRALAYAHNLGITHRDIKPGNIMVKPDRQVKVLDFGLAVTAADTRLTSPGSLVGSMHYVAPELLSGRTADARSDLYAVGITLYEMLTGRLPITGDNCAQIVANHLHHQPEPPSRLCPGIPEALSAAVMKALAKDREQRWTSAAEFLQALDQANLGSAANQLVTATVPFASPISSPASSPDPHAVVQPEVLREIALNLARHVGPIANVLVKRASTKTHNVRELCEQVAREIESTEARQKFLRAVQPHMREL